MVWSGQLPGAQMWAKAAAADADSWLHSKDRPRKIGGGEQVETLFSKAQMRPRRAG